MSLFTKAAKRQVLDLPVAEIRPNPRQPRRDFPPGELAELALSISQVGVLQPLSVRRTPTGWELVAGERRLRAARLAGLAAVPCLPVEADGDTSALLALVENLQRKDLDVWEEAAALRQLIDRHHLSQEEAARGFADYYGQYDKDGLLNEEMREAFQPEYVIFRSSGLEVMFPAGTLPSQESATGMYLAYEEAEDILQEWAVPDSTESD